jgi:hypothetical protein
MINIYLSYRNLGLKRRRKGNSVNRSKKEKAYFEESLCDDWGSCCHHILCDYLIERGMSEDVRDHVAVHVSPDAVYGRAMPKPRIEGREGELLNAVKLLLPLAIAEILASRPVEL